MAVIALEIAQRSLVLDGRPFGAAGAYEKVAGVLRFAVDPARPANAPIADLALAPRNAEGRVECWAEGAEERAPAPPRWGGARSRPANAPIADLALAPRNAEGRVECWADFY